MLLLGSVIAWRIAASVLRPVRAVTTTARRISTGADLTERLPVTGHDELAELSSTFNGMLDELEEAFDAQQRFVDDAGHELRTPITVIRGHLDLMGDDPEERRATLVLIDDELGRMHRIVNDLLTLAKAERADFLRLGPVDLADLTEEVHAKAEALGDRGWQPRRRGPRHRDRGPTTADPGDDAARTERGPTHRRGRRDRDRLAASVGAEVELWVRDTGEGIAPTDVERIFDRFARGGRKRASDGAGLGLSIVRAIAEAHHGRVEVTSETGRGEQVRHRRARRSAAGPTQGTRVSHVLIVEDEERIASFLDKGLRANGFTTVIAPTGEHALAQLRTERFDLVILDIGLPGIDGHEVLRELRSWDPAIQVVMLTARDEVDDTIHGLEGGADDYVTKPFRFDELLARVRARLRGERAASSTAIEAGDCVLDLRTRRMTVDGRKVELTAREFTLAETFFSHPGQVLSREQLLSRVWGFDYDPGSNVVDVYVGYLRKKIGNDRIATVRGMGYRFDPR